MERLNEYDGGVEGLLLRHPWHALLNENARIECLFAPCFVAAAASCWLESRCLLLCSSSSRTPPLTLSIPSPACRLQKVEISSERKSVQKSVDTAILGKLDDLTKSYLGARFTLSKGEYPHQLKF